MLDIQVGVVKSKNKFDTGSLIIAKMRALFSIKSSIVQIDISILFKKMNHPLPGSYALLIVFPAAIGLIWTGICNETMDMGVEHIKTYFIKLPEQLCTYPFAPILWFYIKSFNISAMHWENLVYRFG